MCTPPSIAGHLSGVSLPSATMDRTRSERVMGEADAEDHLVRSKRLLPLPARSSLLSQQRSLLRLHPFKSHLMPSPRRKREMTPASKKDAAYWDKRRKNNEAAKRSREKRRLNDLMMEGQLLALSKENTQLRAEVFSLHCHTHLGRDAHTSLGLNHHHHHHRSSPFSASSTTTGTATTSGALQFPAVAQGYPLVSRPQSPSIWGFKSGCLPLLDAPRGGQGAGKLPSLALPSPVSLGVFQRAQDSSSLLSGSSPLLVPTVVPPPQWGVGGCGPPPQALPALLFKPASLIEPPTSESSTVQPKPEKASQNQVSSSDDSLAKEVGAVTPIQKAFRPPVSRSTSGLSLPPTHPSLPSSSSIAHGSPSTLLSHVGQNSPHESLLLPWSSTCLYPSSLYPSLPLSLYLPLTDPELPAYQRMYMQRNFSGKFSRFQQN
ncbi:proline-rich protein 36 [Engraulis encrasicolus]|uniref:proline-rich protein 36 n=1 Tax=Engraulis encrasicolus TaxID=184585 RepID=UPI002FD1A670